MKSGFCLNSRRWVDFFWVLLKSCPYLEEKWCQDRKCAYYEDREMSKYAKRKLKILKSFGRDNESE